ncbi:sugar transferase [Nocardioides jensenii]|uniref:sugar transferase n=1 Tax=Nocardioides jensenii TaxID=1843 RepID=UPI00082EC0D2|nr:sugar transferase [Nocardioides jensenii]
MSMYERFGKRGFDCLASSLVAIISSPIHAMCALAVLLTSGRPIYFTQERAGRGGEAFRLLKFRTMKVGTHEASGGYPSASMVTPVGRVLRKTSLDELPQLLNIVKGDMSVVGPRPALMDQAARYDDVQRGRLAIRPGLTGVAQLRYRNNAPWSVRIKADLEYARSISLLGDLRIIFQTIPAVLRGDSVVTGQTVADVDDLGQSSVGVKEGR